MNADVTEMRNKNEITLIDPAYSEGFHVYICIEFKTKPGVVQ